ncbi:MAG: hypothetical protein CO093_01030 [Alphaproteobacteria bacterium CG_4_9_14_3_um_filter_47_13]|nr:MAG: hypothetical protein CO093_01030 [Alphaproteobacteria bacterium CG_4_9_14_3_um_filter_47_13]
MAHKKNSYQYGIFAENIVAWGLRLRGYKILAKRYKTPVGEIDLIASHKNIIIFIEVKARHNLSTALQALTPHMKKRIIRAAGYFIARHSAFSNYGMRFDLIAIAPPFYWEHLDNAWQVSV